MICFDILICIDANNINGNVNDIFCDPSTNYDEFKSKFSNLNRVRVDCAGVNPTVVCDCCTDWDKESGVNQC